LDDRGNFIATMGLLTDATERKQANEALRNSEQRFRDLAELLPQTIYEVDREGRLTFVNRHALEMFGYTQAEFEAGLSCFQMLASHEHDRARQNMQRAVDGHALGGTEYTAQRKDGTQFPVVIYSSPILCDQAPAGLRGIIVDVTERKQAEDKAKSLAKFPEENPNPVARIGGDGRVLYANPPAQALLRGLGSAVDSPAPAVWRDWTMQTRDEHAAHLVEWKYEGRTYVIEIAHVAEGGYANLYNAPLSG
jgi:PAS domain S-box-containing protein